MKILLIILIALVALYLVATIFMGNLIINIIFKANKKDYEAIKLQDAFIPEAFDAYEKEWDRHPFSIGSWGETIKGEYIINPADQGPVKKVALICHGHNVSRYSDLKYAIYFYELGYNLVIFDQRYFGESTGAHCSLGQWESHDTAELVKYTRSIFGQDCFLAMHGESMGAASELLALKYEDVAPDYIIADCPFANTRDLLTFLARKVLGPVFYKPAVFFAHALGIIRGKYDFDEVNPIEAVDGTMVPICFIHGDQDGFIPCEHSKRMFEVAKNPDNELHLMPGADHAQSNKSDPAGYKKIIENFARKMEAASSKL